jgi:hypothetical protein
MKKINLMFVLIAVSSVMIAQDTLRVCFIGNSYTAVNNLPSLVQQCASSAGKAIVTSSNTPGGYTFAQHVNNASSMGLIQQGNWDFVVLQEQSQTPSFPIGQVETQCFPYAAQLNDSIEKYSRCGETVFYQTWGRQNGDASNCPNWPPVCTYEGMDSLLRLRYQMMADDNEALVSPVGACWRYIRTNYPDFNLYNADQSHPALFGSYVGALCFYATFFNESPDAVTFTAGLTAQEVAIAKEAVNTVLVGDWEEWNIGDFAFQVNTVLDTVGFSIVIESDCNDCDSMYWYVGDGTVYEVPSFTHTYTQPGLYGITMVAYQCGEYDSQYWEAYIENPTGMKEEQQLVTIDRIAHDSVRIQLKGQKKLDLALFQSNGQLLKLYSIQGENNIISLPRLSSGLYILKSTNNEQVATFKFNY